MGRKRTSSERPREDVVSCVAMEQAFFVRKRRSREGESTVATDLGVLVRNGREKRLQVYRRPGQHFSQIDVSVDKAELKKAL